uniref:G_PROTEIN_RECEP_F1_2 domain-containing protein n=1 Tax=Ascaris lumbricoides TaxID=6252 RepID=A0A0M3I9F7_ASCLU
AEVQKKCPCIHCRRPGSQHTLKVVKLNWPVRLFDRRSSVESTISSTVLLIQTTASVSLLPNTLLWFLTRHNTTQQVKFYQPKDCSFQRITMIVYDIGYTEQDAYISSEPMSPAMVLDDAWNRTTQVSGHAGVMPLHIAALVLCVINFLLNGFICISFHYNRNLFYKCHLYIFFAFALINSLSGLFPIISNFLG